MAPVILDQVSISFGRLPLLDRVGLQIEANEDESAIIAMLLDDYCQRTLHAPIPQPAGVTVSSRPGHAGASRHRRRSRR
jgi:hypothetical protein